MPDDSNTSIRELKRQILAMCRRKGWGDENGVQNPQHVAMAMTVEMAELLEHFQWLNAADVERLLRGDDPERVALIGEEFADVMMYGLQLADALHIDVTQQILRKIDNRQAPGTDHSNFHNNLSFQIICT